MILSLFAAHFAQAGELPSTQAERISDPVIRGDHQRIGGLQDRLHGLNNTGKWQVDEYHFAKAQCWLDFAFSEYHENERGPIIEQALAQARGLIEGMEAGGQHFNENLVLVGESQKIRPDLWAGLEAYKQDKNFPRCAAAVTGCLEVQLNWSGHEYKQSGWRQANPHIGIAEDMLATGKRQLETCPPLAVPPAPEIITPPPICTEKITLAADTLFKFDQSDLANMLEAGKTQLDALASKVKGLPIRKILVVGHTDRKGSMAYNIPLSERRAATVKAYFEQQNVDGNIIQTLGKAFTEPVMQCSTKLPRQAEIDCLQPNRRVEVILESDGVCK